MIITPPKRPRFHWAFTSPGVGGVRKLASLPHPRFSLMGYLGFAAAVVDGAVGRWRLPCLLQGNDIKQGKVTISSRARSSTARSNAATETIVVQKFKVVAVRTFAE